MRAHYQRDPSIELLEEVFFGGKRAQQSQKVRLAWDPKGEEIALKHRTPPDTPYENTSFSKKTIFQNDPFQNKQFSKYPLVINVTGT